jgi:hypothetical protein
METANIDVQTPVEEIQPKPNSISDVVNQLGLFQGQDDYQAELENKLCRAMQLFEITRDAASVILERKTEESFSVVIKEPGKRSIELNKTFGMQTIKSIDLDGHMSLTIDASVTSVRLSELQGAQIKAILLGQSLSLNLKTIILEPDGDGWTKIKLQVSLPATPNHLIDFTIPQKRSK